MDPLDRAYLSYLKEIERSYISLPKALRIRVEKWISKLSSVGKNPAWRKQRNQYSKLLLNMIVFRSLTEPFDKPPPEGALPAFPSYLIGKGAKDLMGTHESSFWRETYELFDKTSRHIEENDIDNSISYQKPNQLNDLSYVNRSFDRESFRDTTINVSQDKEIANLKLLVQEQNQRINFLEQQLKDQKVQHELAIQRLQYTHRLELNKISNDSIAVHNRELSNLKELSNHSLANINSDVKNYSNNNSKNELSFNIIDQKLTNQSSNSILNDSKQQDFLSYLESFQNELKNLQNSSPSKSIRQS